MVFLVAAITAIIFAEGVFAGYPSFLCPASDANNQTFFPCNSDCIYQHGASDGMCGPQQRGDYNCYCGRLTGARVEVSLHCIAPVGKFRELCVVDCQCNHGARTGVCDFERKVCKCVGHDPYNTLCQFPTVAEFADFTAAIVPPDSAAWGYLQYFVERPTQCAEEKKDMESPKVVPVEEASKEPATEEGQPTGDTHSELQFERRSFSEEDPENNGRIYPTRTQLEVEDD